MRRWSAEQIAAAAGARVLPSASGSGEGPERASIDSRQAEPGVLFVGLPGSRSDGGSFASQALQAGAWGVLVAPQHAAAAAQAAPNGATVLAAEDPLAALQRLATAWRRALAAQVIGVTGSTGKTSTKDLLLGLLAPHRRTVASRANFNTEIGLPLEILSAPWGTEVLVLEMAMRGAGQIAELARVAEPNVGVIVNVGPVHLELLGSLEAVAAAKAELIAALPQDGTAVIPANEPLLEPHLRRDVRTISFGGDGDVRLERVSGDRLELEVAGQRIQLEVSFAQAHMRTNLLAAVAAASAIGVVSGGRVELELSPGRGQPVALERGITLIDDSYNANPMSMRAALDELAASATREQAQRRVAVLGDMLELGPEEKEFHAAVGEYAQAAGVDLLVTVGPRAAAMAERFGAETHSVLDAVQAAELVPALIGPGDVVLVKASRGVGLELVCGALRATPQCSAQGAGR
ncbi:MAG TPA: UDP-N-acetylmuramoyl-tripeptide--D-alanyl-D-alanine ligase [Solirubrobacteraceae bacterium]|jgi:UDP-N-acetylmuramoyl-tripeptide--D-alanyl-D-alanine ligase|nr:UDP-N-acetylmuramoyl-tripeptide--D-alanyl-D-alanine ligase [Solirubrobacteraceae bacterium]